jgi:hypothetical protein
MSENSGKPGWGLYIFGTKATQDFWAPRDALVDDDARSWAALDEWRKSCRRPHRRATWEEALGMAEPWAYECITTAHYLLMRAGHATVAPRIAMGEAALDAIRARYPQVMSDPIEKHYMWAGDYMVRLAAGESVEALNAAVVHDIVVRSASSLEREIRLLREHGNIRDALATRPGSNGGFVGELCRPVLCYGYALMVAQVIVRPPTSEELESLRDYGPCGVVAYLDAADAVSAELAEIARRFMGPEVLAGCAAMEARMALKPD